MSADAIWCRVSRAERSKIRFLPASWLSILRATQGSLAALVPRSVSKSHSSTSSSATSAKASGGPSMAAAMRATATSRTVGVAVAVGEGDGVGVGDGVAVAVGEGDGVGVGDGVAVAVGDGVAVAVGEGNGVRVGDGAAVAVGEGDGVRVGDGVVVAVGDGTAVVVGEGPAAGTRVAVDIDAARVSVSDDVGGVVGSAAVVGGPKDGGVGSVAILDAESSHPAATSDANSPTMTQRARIPVRRLNAMPSHTKPVWGRYPASTRHVALNPL